MKLITLTSTITKTPDLSGFRFFVEAGNLFDADDFAEAYNLNRHNIDAQHIHSTQDKAGQLNDGEWLEVSFEVEEAGYAEPTAAQMRHEELTADNRQEPHEDDDSALGFDVDGHWPN